MLPRNYKPPKMPKYYIRPKGALGALKGQPAAAEAEGLVGVVQGQEASDLEERWGNSLEKLKKQHSIESYSFKWDVPGAYEIPGQERTVDFLVYAGVKYPIEVDGDYAHRNQEEDDARDEILNEILRLRGGYSDIIHVHEDDISTPEESDTMAEKILLA